MARIVLSEPDGPYSCTFDTRVMEVKLFEVFNGVQFVSDSGEKLSVSMRDNGFEVHYFKDGDPINQGWYDFKNGTFLEIFPKKET